MTYNPNDPYRATMTDDEIRRQARLNSLDNEIQADPELAEGALFYGLNNTSVHQAGTSPSSQTAQTQPANPAAPPGMRDVTPKSNGQPGVTTGASPQRPAPAPVAPADNAPTKQ